MALIIITHRKAQYYKLPFFMLIHFLLKDGTIRNSLNFVNLKALITNMYIYAFLFTNSGKSKNKTLVAYNVLDKIHSKNNGTIKDILDELKAVRKEFLNDFELFRNFHAPKAYPFYSIMDHYIANDNFIKQVYSLENEYTQEHFLIHNNKYMEVTWKDDINTFSFSLKELLGKPNGKNYKGTLYKKQTTNYIILPKKLNEDIGHVDIVSKINAIKDYHEKCNLPTHIDLFIKYIEDMPAYTKLVELKGKHKTQQTIKKEYREFINEYFSDENQASLYKKLEKKFKSTFHNHTS